MVTSPASPETPPDPATPPGLAGQAALTATTPAAPFAAAAPVPTEVPLQPGPAQTNRRISIAGLPAALLVGLVVLVVAGGILGSVSLLAHYGVLSARSSVTAPTVVRGGTWTEDFPRDPDSMIPDTSGYPWAVMAQQALYLPLFYGDAHGVVHPGAATEIPTVQNGGVSADATTWTFHLRPHLLWSDGQPYDARDVDYTWKLWRNPTFGDGGTIPGLRPEHFSELSRRTISRSPSTSSSRLPLSSHSG